MMTAVRDLTKRSAIARAEGKNLGRPVDVLVDLEKHRVALIVFAHGKIPELSVVCDADAVESFANAVVNLKEIASLHLAVHDEGSLEDLQHGLSIRGRPVYSKDGVSRGRISSVEINENGAVIEYRSRYPWYKAGWFRGKNRYTPAQLETVGTDTVVTRDAESS